MPALVAIIVAFVATIMSANAETMPDTEKYNLDEKIEKLSHEMLQNNTGVNCIIAGKQSDACVEYWDSRFRTEAKLAEIGPEVFRWQMFASNVVLVLVVILTISGIIMAALQMWWGRRDSIDVNGDKEDPRKAEITFDFKSIRIQSSIVGVFILVFAYIFLIVFLREVYHIDIVKVSQ